MDGWIDRLMDQSIKSSFIDYTFEKNAEGFTRTRIWTNQSISQNM